MNNLRRYIKEDLKRTGFIGILGLIVIPVAILVLTWLTYQKDHAESTTVKTDPPAKSEKENKKPADVGSDTSTPQFKMPSNWDVYASIPSGYEVPQSLPIRRSDQVMRSAELKTDGKEYYLLVSNNWWGPETVRVEKATATGATPCIMIIKYGRVTNSLEFGVPITIGR